MEKNELRKLRFNVIIGIINEDPKLIAWLKMWILERRN